MTIMTIMTVMAIMTVMTIITVITYVPFSDRLYTAHLRSLVLRRVLLTQVTSHDWAQKIPLIWPESGGLVGTFSLLCRIIGLFLYFPPSLNNFPFHHDLYTMPFETVSE